MGLIVFLFMYLQANCEVTNMQDPVVQSIVCLTSSLMTTQLTMQCNAKATHIFAAKNIMYLPYLKIEILTS